MTAPPPPGLGRLLGHVTTRLAAEPPDGSVVRIMYGGAAFDPDYLTRADEHAALSGWPDGQHWYPIGDDEPVRWNSVLNAAAGNDAEIEVLVPVPSVEESARRAKVLREQMEQLIGEAYEIGYAHGGNAQRLERGQAPHREHAGWEPLVDQAVAAIEGEAQ